jgi:Flp pilus assembly protein TadG
LRLTADAPLDRRRSRRGERGYATVLVGLLMLPLLAFAGLALDIGAWYARAAEIQRVADASALAGVPLLMRGDAPAIAEARRVATLNGFTDGDEGNTIHVSANRVPGQQRLRVTIRDDSVPQFITRAFRSAGVAISRTATAEQVMPVPLGSPRNYLGTNLLLPTSSHREGFWAALSGYCASREQGERLGAISDANFQTTANPPSGTNPFVGCQPGSPTHVIPNAEYTADGYFYAVEVPPTYTGRLRVQIFDAPMCGTSGPETTDQTFDTRVRMRDNDSLSPTEATVLLDQTLVGRTDETGACAGPSMPGTGAGGAECSGTQWHNCWRTIFDQTNPQPGIYFVQLNNVPTTGTSESQDGSNMFALRAVQGGSFVPCSGAASAVPPSFSTTCPNVYALTHLGVYAGVASTAQFYLAEIGPEHNNKTMEITLWDTGEGMTRIEVLNPLGVATAFDWQVLCQNGNTAPCASETAPTGGYGPFLNRNQIDVSGSGHPQPGTHRLSSSRYNDRLIRIEVPLPADITGAYGGATWWRIRYTPGSSPTDRTTWSVIVRGDPVRLVPN